MDENIKCDHSQETASEQYFPAFQFVAQLNKTFEALD